MRELFFLFLLVLVSVAIFLREDFVFTILYLLVGAFFVSRWWGRHSVQNLTIDRNFESRAFLGETVRVELVISNRGWLPLTWLHIRESLPFELFANGSYKQVISLGMHAQTRLAYYLTCTKRGYYPLGPLLLESSDVLGMAPTQRRQGEPTFLTVYPKIVPLTKVDLPSFAPLGTLRHRQPIFEDPSRVLGKRDYVVGDSIRRIDWKSTASSGRLQVKLFEPSIALDVAIFLNLNSDEFHHKARHGVSELAIVIAASMANWIVKARQSVGLVTNGVDPLLDDKVPPPIPPRRGRSHLLRILDSLARIQTARTISLANLLEKFGNTLSWGTTILVISNQLGDHLFDGIFQMRRAGLNALLIQCGPTDNYHDVRRKALHFGFPIYQVLSESDLDVWRR